MLVVALRKPARELFPLIQKLKYREFEVEFGQRLREVQREVAAELSENTEAPSRADTLGVLAAVSPRAAVLEAWRDVELAALEAARFLGGESFRNKTLTFQAISLLNRLEGIEPSIIEALQDLRSLRNDAAHAPEFALSTDAALAYTTSARTVADHLRQLVYTASRQHQKE